MLVSRRQDRIRLDLYFYVQNQPPILKSASKKNMLLSLICIAPIVFYYISIKSFRVVCCKSLWNSCSKFENILYYGNIRGLDTYLVHQQLINNIMIVQCIFVFGVRFPKRLAAENSKRSYTMIIKDEWRNTAQLCEHIFL